tara:strand:- start:143 stop:1009 length:867 start_codon:yes stop_codon:yes gene_type:complete
MITNFLKNYIKNKIYIFIIILIGITFSIIFSKTFKIHYKGSVQLQMAYIESKRLFDDEKVLIYPIKGHNIFLIEKLFKDIQTNKIKVNQKCFKGSVFDDSNEFSAKRKQLGFSPGYDFKISRTDFELTVEYRDSQNIIKECLESFVKAFSAYQEELYNEHVNAQKSLYTLGYNTNWYFWNFITEYAKKYNLSQYQDIWNANGDMDETYKKILDSGANLEIAKLYLVMVQEFVSTPEFTTTFYKKTPVKLINEITVEELKNHKLLIIIIINFISFLFTFIFVIIKEYDY